jgi:hypothetical protein
MDERLPDRIIQFIGAKWNFPWILNRNLRLGFQHVCISSLYGPASNLFISGIPSAKHICRQLTAPGYAVFSGNDRSLPIPAGVSLTPFQVPSLLSASVWRRLRL